MTHVVAISIWYVLVVCRNCLRLILYTLSFIFCTAQCLNCHMHLIFNNTLFDRTLESTTHRRFLFMIITVRQNLFLFDSETGISNLLSTLYQTYDNLLIKAVSHSLSGGKTSVWCFKCHPHHSGCLHTSLCLMSSSNGILSVECGEDWPWEVISGKINYCFVLFFSHWAHVIYEFMCGLLALFMWFNSLDLKTHWASQAVYGLTRDMSNGPWLDVYILRKCVKRNT